jgi:hypothetical protein
MIIFPAHDVPRKLLGTAFKLALKIITTSKSLAEWNRHLSTVQLGNRLPFFFAGSLDMQRKGLYSYTRRFRFPCNPSLKLSHGYLTKDQLEDIVEDVVASSSIWQELETLAVVHWPLLLIDLQRQNLANAENTNATSMASRQTQEKTMTGTYQQSTGHQDYDASGLIDGLCVQSGHLVLYLGKR